MFNKSFLKIFINKPMGVTNKKKIINKTNGEIIFPSNSPNFNQIFLSGLKTLEFKIPNVKKIIAIIIDHILKCPSFIIGQTAIIKKTIKKSIPNPLLLPFFLICLALSKFLVLCARNNNKWASKLKVYVYVTYINIKIL